MSGLDEERRALIEEFRVEARERLQRINLGWLDFEKEPARADLADRLKRELHTLKGEAKMAGYGEVSRLAHRAEDLVAQAAAQRERMPVRLGDVLLAVTDTMANLLLNPPGSDHGDASAKDAHDLIDGIVGATPEPRASVATAMSSGAASESRPVAPAPPVESEETPVDSAAPRVDSAAPQLSPAGPRAETAPAPDEVAASPRSASRASATSGREAASDAESYLRIDADVVASFGETASEIVVAHVHYARIEARLADLEKRMTAALSSVPGFDEEVLRESNATAAGEKAPAPAPQDHGASWLPEVATLLRELRSVRETFSDQLHEGTLQAKSLDARARRLRLIPIASLLSRFARPVRDLAREHGKEVDLRIEANRVAIDKHIADRLAEPLLHLVRNAVDHGIESPNERTAKRKPPAGTLHLRAREQGSLAIIDCEDDGRGVDKERVLSRAVGAGLVSADEAPHLSEPAMLDLLFRPGFSTRSEVTETSGRGVGLDVVKREVERLGGSVVMSSRAGAGTRFELRVPIQAALAKVLVVADDHGELFAFPSYAVETIVLLEPDSIVATPQGPTLHLRDAFIPIAPLAALDGSNRLGAGEIAVVLKHGSARIAIVVATTRSAIEVVIKPLDPLFACGGLIAGACVLDRGELALVLDPMTLARRLSRGEGFSSPGSPGAAPAAGSTAAAGSDPFATAMHHRQRATATILLVEDSHITRAMVRSILTSFGYRVLEADDGAAGLRCLEKEHVDVVITDIEMPVMNGLELVTAARARSQWKHLPIIVLSSRGSDEDKRRALTAGADSYLVKSTFCEADLREVVERSLGR